MLEAIANLALFILGTGLVVVWIVSLVQWDGKGCDPNEQDCNRCPLPCDYHKKDEHFGGNEQ